MELPDTSELLKPCAAGGAGENLEYDPLYQQMEQLAVPVPDSEVGDSVNAGRDADWRTLISNTQQLWQKTRDLRVAAYHAIAAFCLNGLPGLLQGLQMIDFLCSSMWDSFYPQLDPDDDNDPTERLNILSMLSPQPGSYNDPIDFIGHFRRVRLCDELPYTLRDVMIAQGMLQNTGESVDMALLQAQLRQLPEGVLSGRKQLLDEIIALVDKISADLAVRIPDAGTEHFAALSRELRFLQKFYDSQLSFGGSAAASAPAAEAQPASSGSAPAAAPAAGPADLHTLSVSSRADALLLIKKSADYFRQAEPSSPLPYLLDRALRMSEMNFMEILAEIDRNNLDKAREQLGVIEQQD